MKGIRNENWKACQLLALVMIDIHQYAKKCGNECNCRSGHKTYICLKYRTTRGQAPRGLPHPQSWSLGKSDYRDRPGIHQDSRKGREIIFPPKPFVLLREWNFPPKVSLFCSGKRFPSKNPFVLLEGKFPSKKSKTQRSEASSAFCFNQKASLAFCLSFTFNY